MDCEACSRGLTATQCRYCRRYVCPEHSAPASHDCVTLQVLHPGVDFNSLAKIDSQRKTVKIAAASLAFMIAGLIVFNPPIMANYIPTSSISAAVSDSLINPAANELANVTSFIYSFVAPVSIDKGWVTNFISILNQHRTTPLTYCPRLDGFAKLRFTGSTAGSSWQISSFGLDRANQDYFGRTNSVQEEVLHPAGYKPSTYYNTFITSLSNHAILDPSNIAYSYYVGTAPSITPNSPCLVHTLGANVNMTEYYSHNGCSTTVENTVWLLLVLAPTCPS